MSWEEQLLLNNFKLEDFTREAVQENQHYSHMLYQEETYQEVTKTYQKLELDLVRQVYQKYFLDFYLFNYKIGDFVL